MLAIINGTIHTITDGIIPKGTVLIDGGQIVGVGTDLVIPSDAQVIDAARRALSTCTPTWASTKRSTISSATIPTR